jgi:hypothetical protein
MSNLLAVYLDAGVNSAATAGITGFKTDALTQFGTVLPIAFGILVTVALVFAAISWFRALVHL